MLLRQIHPSWVQEGNITSQAFQPTMKDEDRLSVYDGDRISPEESWEHYTKDLSFESVGVMGVTVKECKELGPIPKDDPIPFPEHIVIDFSSFGSSATKRIAKKLKAKAVARGWQYQT